MLSRIMKQMENKFSESMKKIKAQKGSTSKASDFKAEATYYLEQNSYNYDDAVKEYKADLKAQAQYYLR